MRPTFCARCGTSLAPENRVCTACGADALPPSAPVGGTATLIDGRYEVLERLGEGAFGPTYLVQDHQSGVRSVLKIRDYADPDIASRLAREAAAFGAIRHPNIAAVTGQGVTADGKPYLVIQHIPGTPLDRIISARRIKQEDAVRAAIALGGALQALHERNILHRDLKPSNVIIPGIDLPEFDRATLIDFGVFGELAQRSHGQNVTVVGEVFGTPAYMSPEQAQGKGQSTAADVYSLGLVLYEMLLPDRPLFTGSVLESLLARMSGDVVIASDAPIAPALRALIASMLRVDPEQRVGLDEVLTRLRAVTGPSQTSAPRPPISEVMTERGAPPTTSPASRQRKMPLVIVVLVVTVAAIAFVLLSPMRSGSVPNGESARTVIGIVSGLAIIAAGFAIAYLTRRFAASRRPAVEGEAAKVMLGTRTREALTATLALQVDDLVQRCQAMGEAYWGHTVALMLREYQDARDSKDRREALMNVVVLLEKVTTRLSPWYVRHDKMISTAVATVGILGGVWKIAYDIINMTRGDTR